MVLIIDTTLGDDIEVRFSGRTDNIRRRLSAPRQQAEKLLPLIVKMMKDYKIAWSDFDSISVQNTGESFSALRIGVLTANALAYALQIPIQALDAEAPLLFIGGQSVKPRYQSEPNIGKAKKAAC
jgi:tRNA A37 threonylcarbamoyladenosine modification protein TsaB